MCKSGDLVPARLILRSFLGALVTTVGICLGYGVAAAGQTSAEAEHGPKTQWPISTESAKLHLLTNLVDAHVYVYPSGRDCPVAVCTNLCDLELPSGEYHLKAGESHRGLATAPQALSLAKGDDTRLKVEVRERSAARYAGIGLLMVGASGLVGAIMSSFAHGSFRDVSRDKLTVSLIIVGSATGFAGGGLGYWWSRGPDVDYREWEE